MPATLCHLLEGSDRLRLALGPPSPGNLSNLLPFFISVLTLGNVKVVVHQKLAVYSSPHRK